MNFNLISPSTNGNDYSINFRDAITIKPNSQLRLNWAEFQRKGTIVLEQDASFDFTLTNNLPTHLPGTPATANEIVLPIQVARGTYTFTEFQDHIEDLIITAINSAANKEIHRYTSATVDDNNGSYGQGLQDDGQLGLILEPSTFSAFAFDSANSHDGSQSTSGGVAVAYTTANNNGTYDNYANSDVHYDFYRANCPKDTTDENAYAIFQSINTVDSQTGRIFFGLIGKEYTDGIGGAPPTRTTGNNPPV